MNRWKQSSEKGLFTLYMEEDTLDMEEESSTKPMDSGHQDKKGTKRKWQKKKCRGNKKKKITNQNKTLSNQPNSDVGIDDPQRRLLIKIINTHQKTTNFLRQNQSQRSDEHQDPFKQQRSQSDQLSFNIENSEMQPQFKAKAMNEVFQHKLKQIKYPGLFKEQKQIEDVQRLIFINRKEMNNKISHGSYGKAHCSEVNLSQIGIQMPEQISVLCQTPKIKQKKKLFKLVTSKSYIEKNHKTSHQFPAIDLSRTPKLKTAIQNQELFQQINSKPKNLQKFKKMLSEKNYTSVSKADIESPEGLSDKKTVSLTKIMKSRGLKHRSEESKEQIKHMITLPFGDSEQNRDAINGLGLLGKKKNLQKGEKMGSQQRVMKRISNIKNTKFVEQVKKMKISSKISSINQKSHAHALSLVNKQKSNQCFIKQIDIQL